MSKIMIVDDDPHIRELAGVFLKREGFDILEASDGVEALGKLEAVKADLVIVDIMMPKMDGWELCRELKASSDVPVLMLTARGETSQKLKGFQLGTDDYLVKPFEPLELVARVKALLKRYRIATSQTIQAGKILMDRKAYTVKVDGQDLTLPLKEFELLFKLASEAGRTFTREQPAAAGTAHREGDAWASSCCPSCGSSGRTRKSYASPTSRPVRINSLHSMQTARTISARAGTISWYPTIQRRTPPVTG